MSVVAVITQNIVSDNCSKKLNLGRWNILIPLQSTSVYFCRNIAMDRLIAEHNPL